MSNAVTSQLLGTLSERFGGRIGTPLWRLGIFLCIVTPVALLAGLGYWQTHKSMTEATLQRRQSLAHLSALALKLKLDNLTNVGLSLASRVQFRALVAQGNWEEAIRILERVPTDLPYIERLFITDTAGTLRADTPPMPDVRGVDFSQRDWFKGVSREWKPYVSEVYKRAAEPRYNVIASAIPIKKDDGEPLGILVMQVRVETLLDWSREISPGGSGFVYFVDQKGRAAAHPKFMGDEIADLTKAPAVERVLRGERGVLVAFNPVEQEDRVSAYEPVPGYGWGVVAQQPTKEAFAAREEVLQNLILRNGAVLLISALLGASLVFGLEALHRERGNLKRAEEKFRALLESAPDAMLITKRDGALALVNAQAEKLFGYTRAELLKMNVEQLMPQRFRQRHVEYRKHFSDAPTARPMGIGLELYALRKNGEEVPVEISLSPIQTEEGVVSLASVRDVTNRRRLQQERDRLFNVSLDMMCVASGDGYFKHVNPAFTESLGWSAEEMVKRPFIEFVHPDDREPTLKEVERQVVKGERVLHFENRYRHKDGSWRWLSWQSVPQNDGLMYATARDVTAQKDAEERVKQLNQQLTAVNHELEAFAYSVSHDLRAPLRSIDGFSLALVEDCGDKLNDEERDHLARIRAATQRMGMLIDDLLNLSRVSRSELRIGKADLTALARDVVAELRQQEPQRRVEVRIAEGLKVEGDARLMRLVLQNLLGNAWKFTSKVENARIEFGSEQNGDGTAYFVRDNGAGFDMKYADKLFGAFQRLHSASEFPGTGIGLATVQRILHRHGGHVWATSELGKGATFYFQI